MTSRAIASCGSDMRSYELASHSRGDIRLYVIAYGGMPRHVYGPQLIWKVSVAGCGPASETVSWPWALR